MRSCARVFHSSSRPGWATSRPTTRACGRTPAIRVVPIPSPQPTSSTLAALDHRTCASSSFRNPATRRRATGFRVSYLSYVLPAGPCRSPSVASLTRRALAMLRRVRSERVGPHAELQLDVPPAGALAFADHAVGAQQVADDAEQEQLHRDEDQHPADEQRLHVAGGRVL